MTFFQKRDLIARLPGTVSVQEKAILFRLHDYSGKRNRAYASQERLGADVSLKPRQLRKYLAALKRKSLIVSKRRRQAASVVELRWEIIEHLAQDRHSSAAQDSVKTGTPAPVSAKQERHCGVSREALQGRKSGTPAPIERKENVERTQIPVTGARVDSQPAQNSRSEAARPASLSRAPKLTPADFSDLARGIEVIDGLVMAGNLSRDHRLGALSLWHRIDRTLAGDDAGKLQSPSGVFYAAVKSRRFLCSDGDEIEAERFLKAHDRGVSASKPINPLMAVLADNMRPDVPDGWDSSWGDGPR